MTVKFITLGCKTNIYESEAMARLFEKDGAVVVKDGKADICVISTCTVTAQGAAKSVKAIRRAKRENPGSIIAVCGCLSQTEPERIEKIGADVIIGNKYRNEIVSLCKAAAGGEKIYKIDDILKACEYEELGLLRNQHRMRAEIKIEDGCNNFCSYCKIPYARGPVRSRNIENIVKEAKMLIESGYFEIVLTGIHIGSYGKDLKDNISLADVVTALGGVCGKARIRLGSLEPAVVTEEFIEKIKSVSGVCPHFHLSLQSGCDKTLKAMHRRYTTAEFENAVSRLREAFCDASITTDVIVGFPGETEEDFKKSLEFCRKIGFAHMHIFPYSVREGTLAATLPEKVSDEEKDKRMKLMLNMAKEKKREFYSRFLNRKLLVLYEQEKDGFFSGTTENYLEVRAKGENLCGVIKETLIEAVGEDFLIGRITDKNERSIL